MNFVLTCILFFFGLAVISAGSTFYGTLCHYNHNPEAALYFAVAVFSALLATVIGVGGVIKESELRIILNLEAKQKVEDQ